MHPATSAPPVSPPAAPASPIADVAPAVAAAVAVLTLRIAALAGREGQHLLFDDAFISFRYAQNFANGLGLVFNEGERVEGYTNFLWTVLLAGAARLGLDIVSTSVVLAAVCTIATTIVLAAFGRVLFDREPHARLLIAIAPVLFAAWGPQARYVLSGMETSCFVLLVVTGAWLATLNRPLAAGAIFGAATLTRPEGAAYFVVVVVAALMGAAGRRSSRSAAWLVGAFVAVVGPYFCWRLQYYGLPLPNTYYAKTGGSEFTGPMLQRGWTHLVFAVQQLALVVPSVVAGVAVLLRPHRLWWIAAAFAAVAATEMVVVGGDFQFFFGPRLLLPAAAFACLPVAAGVAAIANLVPPARYRPAAVVAILSGLVLYLGTASWPARDPNQAYVAAINQGWTELGKWLEFTSAPDAVVAVGAAGRIPFYSGRRTIDMLGLTDAHIARRSVPLGGGMPGHEKFDTPYVLGRAPDWVVFVLLHPSGQPAVQDWFSVANNFLETYALVAVVKARDVPGPWVLETEAWTPALADQGYQGGVYRRRQ